jgi:hypothetical protein
MDSLSCFLSYEKPYEVLDNRSLGCVQEKTNRSKDIKDSVKLYVTAKLKSGMKSNCGNTSYSKSRNGASMFFTVTPITVKRNVHFSIPNVSQVWHVPLIEEKIKKNVYYSKRDIMRCALLRIES